MLDIEFSSHVSVITKISGSFSAMKSLSRWYLLYRQRALNWIILSGRCSLPFLMIVHAWGVASGGINSVVPQSATFCAPLPRFLLRSDFQDLVYVFHLVVF